MTPLPQLLLRRVFLRSFAIQGSWNYRTLQGSGFAFALMPVFRWIYRDDHARLQDAVTRHSTLFNAHPYLAGIALGAVARMEADGEDPALIERFKNALRGSLGSMGDRFIWAGWRPACVLLGLLVLVLTHSPAAAVIAFLLPYNSGHLALRWWALRVGVEHGMNVGKCLRQAPFGRWHRAIVPSAAFLIGAAMPLIAAGALAGGSYPTVWLLLPAAAAAAAWRFGAAVRVPAILLLTLFTMAGFLFRTGT